MTAIEYSADISLWSDQCNDWTNEKIERDSKGQPFKTLASVKEAIEEVKAMTDVRWANITKTTSTTEDVESMVYI